MNIPTRERFADGDINSDYHRVTSKTKNDTDAFYDNGVGDELLSPSSGEVVVADSSERSIFSDEMEIEARPTNESKSTPNANALSSIGKKESQDVYRYKIVVVLSLVIVAIVASTLVYVFITKSEQDQFEQEFHDTAYKIFEAIRNSIDNTLMPLDNLAVALVSEAKSHSPEGWPFVRLEDYGVRVAKALPLTDAFWITFLPLVTPDNRLQWENFSRTHDDWLEEHITVQNTWDLYYGPKNITVDRESTKYIHGDFGPLPGNTSRNMLPMWQWYPMIPLGFTAYNYDWLSVTQPAAPNACVTRHRSILAEAFMIPEPENPSTQIEAQGWIDFFSNFVAEDEDPYEPIMDIFYPIIDDIGRVKIVGDANYMSTNNTLVGVLAATVYWRNIIKDILPPGKNGITVVFNNTCTKSFTYGINGPDVVFLGVDDKHEATYDGLRVSSKISELEKFSFTASVYSGAPIDDEHCPYTLHLYPTDEMKSEFTTNSAGLFAALTALVIVALSAVFLLYDFKVERRQKKVLSSAVRSSDIVSSLFPSSVQDQLYPKHDIDENLHPTMWRPVKNEQRDDASKPVIVGTIAKLYPDTTVMFADIKGFTHWSDKREPTDVFCLLETLYGAFDARAKVYDVFKVETIGDTYVAVVGLPSPRKNHAIVMARFAQICVKQMAMVLQNLAPTLGADTMDLSLRIELNSGPTTAGVLRGEKARFQLFGDTVNTAARMESNGEGNRIHISAATAQLIEAAGYR